MSSEQDEIELVDPTSSTYHEVAHVTAVALAVSLPCLLVPCHPLFSSICRTCFRHTTEHSFSALHSITPHSVVMCSHVSLSLGPLTAS